MVEDFSEKRAAVGPGVNTNRVMLKALKPCFTFTITLSVV